MNIILDNTCHQNQFYAIIVINANKLNLLACQSMNSICHKWQLILFSDGSLTQNLYSLTGSYISIKIINQKHHLIIDNKQIRRIWLIDRQKTSLVFAESFIDSKKNKINENIQYSQAPIGKILSEDHKDIYKEIETIYYGHSSYLSLYFDSYEPILARKCSIYYKNQYLMTIHEFFSPKLIYLF